MANTVTYKGPEDPANNSTDYQIDDGDKDINFRLRVPVNDISDKIVKRLKDAKGHSFDIKPDTTTTQGGTS